MTYHGINISKPIIKEFCRRHHIRQLALFGSILREDFGPNSDIDILVTFEPGAAPGFGFMGIQDELSDMLGHQVDLHTPASLSKYFRNDVMQEAEPLYDAA